MDNGGINRNLPILIFVFVYFGFQIFFQIWNYSFHTPSNKNNLQNFISALVLFGLVIYYANPQFTINFTSSIIITISFVIVFIFCYAKKGLDDMSEKDKKLGLDIRVKGLTLLMTSIYGIMALVFVGLYLSRTESLLKAGEIVGIGILLIFLYIFFYKFKVNPDEDNNLPLGLYIYPLLFLTQGLNQGGIMYYIYLILFTSVSALWGFFGVEWFTGKKDDVPMNYKNCKSYLGLSDNELANQLGQGMQTKVNTRNINFIYMAVTLILVSFLLAVIFMYISYQRMVGNM